MPKPCRHAFAEMVLYVPGAPDVSTPRALHWCPRCGALGESMYTKGTRGDAVWRSVDPKHRAVRLGRRPAHAARG
jgi:hypothetical protein